MQKRTTRLTRLGRHLRRNLVAYVALIIAVSMTPLPSYAAKAAIGTKGIKNGAVTTAKIKNNAVTSAKIKDGAVGKADLASAARGFTRVFTVRLAVNVAANGDSERTVLCPAGAVALSGGGHVLPTGIVIIGTTFGEVTKSHPAADGTFAAGDNISPQGWRTRIHNTLGDPTTAVHYAVCASK